MTKLCIVSIVFLLSFNSWSYGGLDAFWRSYENAEIVVSGKVKELNLPEIESWSRVEFQVYKVFKGDKGIKKIDLLANYPSTDVITMFNDDELIICCKRNADAKYKGFYFATWKWKLFPDTEGKIDKTISIIKDFSALKNRKEKVDFILKHMNLFESNPFAKQFLEHRILILRVKETIPYYEKIFQESITEKDKLYNISNLRILEYPQTGKILVSWLKDPNFKNKQKVIDQIQKLKYVEAIPILREMMNSKDLLIATSAAATLYYFKQPDGKKFIEKMSKEEVSKKEGFTRYDLAVSNAKWWMKFGGEGRFNPEQEELIKKFSKSTD
jgi:hypothetical protein